MRSSKKLFGGSITKQFFSLIFSWKTKKIIIIKRKEKKKICGNSSGIEHVT